MEQPSAAVASAGADRAPREDVRGYLRRRPGLPFGGAILIACCLPLLSIPFFSVTLFSLPSTMSFFVNMATAFGREGNAAEVGAIRTAVMTLYLLYLVPAAAVWLLFRELRLEATRRLRLVTGIICLLTPFAVSLLSSSIAGTARIGSTLPRGTGIETNPVQATLNALSFMGIGLALLIFASAALIAVGCGWNPFAGGRHPED